jgi:large subunit ribosomal protein L22
MKAVLNNYRQSPRKVRLIADLVRGKKANEALTILKFVDKRAAGPFSKVIASAIANAKTQGKSVEKLLIKTVQVNKAPTQKRFMPRARGSASRINKRNSHISVELAEQGSTSGKSQVKS